MLHAVGIVVFEDYVYWIDGMSRNVMKIRKSGDSRMCVVQAAIDDLSDMIVVDTRKITGRRWLVLDSPGKYTNVSSLYSALPTELCSQTLGAMPLLCVLLGEQG